MTDLQIFKNDTFGQVRILEKDNELWFVAKDVCDWTMMNGLDLI